MYYLDYFYNIDYNIETKKIKNEIDDAFSYAEDSDFPDYEDFKTAFHLNVI